MRARLASRTLGAKQSSLSLKQDLGREESVQVRTERRDSARGESLSGVKERSRKHGHSEASYYAARSEYGDTGVSDLNRLKRLEANKTWLYRLLAESLLAKEVAREAPRKMVTVQDGLVMVWWMQSKGFSQRRALEVFRMSSTALRDQPSPDRNAELCSMRVKVAQRQRGECQGYNQIDGCGDLRSC